MTTNNKRIMNLVVDTKYEHGRLRMSNFVFVNSCIFELCINAIECSKSAWLSILDIIITAELGLK